MKLTKTLLTTALLGASVFSFQSTAWAIEQSQIIQVEQLYKQKDFKAMLELFNPWQSKVIRSLKIFWEMCIEKDVASNKMILKR